MLSQKQIFIVLGATIVVALLMVFPKGVIQKTEKPQSVQANRDKKEEEVSENSLLHEVDLSPEVKNFVDSLRKEYKKSDKNTLLVKIADTFSDATAFDSATYYYELAQKSDNSLALKLKLSEAYYSLFSISEGKNEKAAQKCKEILQEIVTISPSNLEAKSKLGYVTTLTSQSPMQGVSMLKEVLKQDPNFRTALFDLGLLDIRSGQVDKGVEKFEKLLSLDKTDQLSRFYLAICYKEKKNLAKTRELVDVITKSNANPVLIGEAQKLLVE